MSEKTSIQRIALGGGCHWCTEAVFQALKGVEKVEQGYVASRPPHEDYSEAVLLDYRPELLPMELLLRIHVLTHSSTSRHSRRDVYRSAVYTFNEKQRKAALQALENIQKDMEQNLVTEVLPFADFEASRWAIRDYYFSNPEKPFCTKHIDPKLRLLLKAFPEQMRTDKLRHLL